MLLRIVPSLWAPLNFDESYNLEVVLNLVHGHGYATDGALMGSHLASFDYHITTGPSLLMPVAALVALLGSHVWAFKLVPALFSGALCAVWWRVGVGLGGSWAGLAAVTGLLAMDTTIGWPGIDAFDAGSVIGENTAAFFLLAAVLSLHRPTSAGVLVALSVSAKTILVLGLPGLAVGIFLSARRRGVDVAEPLSRAALGFVGVVAMWQAFKVVSVGWTGALSTDLAYLRFLVSDPYDPGPARRPGWLGHAAIQLGTVGVVGGALAAILAALTVAAAWRRGWRVPDTLRPGVVALAVAGVLLEMWWMLLETEGWPRHSIVATDVWLPLLLSASVACGRYLSRGEGTSEGREWGKVFGLALPPALAAQVVWTAVTAMWHPGPSLSDQEEVADRVQVLGPAFTFTGDHMSPELSVLRPLPARPLTHHGGLLVRSGLWGAASTAGCDRILYQHAGYVVCRVNPTR